MLGYQVGPGYMDNTRRTVRRDLEIQRGECLSMTFCGCHVNNDLNICIASSLSMTCWTADVEHWELSINESVVALAAKGMVRRPQRRRLRSRWIEMASRIRCMQPE